MKVRSLTISLFSLAILLSGCGDDSECRPLLTPLDPSGQWQGVLRIQESDCGPLSRGESFNFNHQVVLSCDSDGSPSVELYNEDGIRLTQTSYSSLFNSSFSVQADRKEMTIDISYDNFNGSQADVTKKIRLYNNGKIICSEKFVGLARR